MPELSAPLRVTWDVPSDPELAAAAWRAMADARVLWAEALLAEDGLGSLERLAAGPRHASPPRLSLVGGAAALLAARQRLGSPSLPVFELLVLAPFGEAGALGELRATAPVVPAVWSSPEGVGAFGDAVAAALGAGLGAVAVLNPPACAGPLSASERARAADAWAAAGRPQHVELRVHDLFLSEALGLAPLEAYAGCQAGAFLAHVDRAGTIRACRTLPAELGDVSRGFREAWSGAARRALRDRLEGVPLDCEPCARSRVCRGGCRGLGRDLGRDASCPARVEPP